MAQRLPTRGAYLALCLALCALTINFWSWSLLGPLGGALSRELELTPFLLSFLLAVPVIIGSLGRIPLGTLTDRFGGKAMFVAISLLAAIPTAGLAYADTYQQLLGVTVLLGVGGAAFVIGVPYLSAWFPPERRGFVLGIYGMGNAGTALSGFATPRLAEQVGRDTTFLIVAGLLVAMAVIFLLLGKEAPNQKKSRGSSASRLRMAASNRLTWDMSAVYIVSFGAFVAFGVYLPVMLNVWYGLPLTDAATRAAGFVLLATLARPVGGWLSDKIGGTQVIRLALFSVIVLAAFVSVQPGLYPQTTFAYLSLAFALGCANGAVLALMSKLTKPEVLGSVSGIVGACGGLGGFLPPLVLGLTYQYLHSYAVALALLALTAALVLVYIHRQFKNTARYEIS